MTQLGGECVFASEIDQHAIETYSQNYNMDSNINVRDIKVEDLPKHDVLCAGFPCQTFSKAGKQEGFDDETRGTLFFEIERILKHHKTKYIILENVRNLASHDKGRTWKIIEEHLHEAGYRLTPKPLIVSPHYFGTPQLRERVIILGVYDPNNINKSLNINLGEFKNKNENSIYDILDKNVDKKYNISEIEKKILTMWNEFYQGINLDIVGFPIWFEWFKKEPSSDFKKWKQKIIEKNNILYQSNKEFIDSWIKKYDNLDWCTPTQKKFEWQAGKNIKSIWEGVIQFRPSGVRVKTPDCFPTLVAITQTPIIGKYKRRLTPIEASRLQDFSESFILNKNEKQCYKQLGNSVNVKVVKKCANELFKY